ncbi:hypothetical protein [Amycolatopsis sp. NPDC049868]|uniref:hypothetical protein n=1 Tax=Amycolatopsis sp. NPDC049868 TaxID=3363934 RepID=UPI0037B57632
MWTWRRKEPGSPQEAPATLPVTRAEWRSLPPIQRVVTEHPLINPVQRFSSSLTSWQSPAYLEPLGHRVGPAEPSGVIDGLARAPRTPPDMPVVQRSVRKRGVLSRLWGMSVQRAAEPDAPVSESLAPEPESVPPAATAQPDEEPLPHEEPLPDEPGPAYAPTAMLEPMAMLEPTAALVLPAVAASSREAGRPSMPLTSAGPSVVPARPPVRTVQAIRSETPSPPLHTPEPAVDSTPPPPELSQPDPGPIASAPTPMAPEPEPADAEPFETVPVQAPDPLPVEPPASEVVTSRPVEPSRPALPVVQRTEQVEAAPRRLGLGAPILPDSGPVEAPVADAPVPVREDDIAEVGAPLGGAVETSVLPTTPPDETSAPVVDETPRPVARMVAGEERIPPATPVETPTSESRTSIPAAVQRSVVEPAPDLPAPKHRDVPLSGASVRRPVQRLRDESPGEQASVQGPVQRLRDESPGEQTTVQRPVQRLRDDSPGEQTAVQPPVQRLRDESPKEPVSVERPVQRLRDESPGEPASTLENAPILVSRAVEPPPSLTAVTSSRSSPGTTFHPPEPPRIRSGTPEIPEPPGAPGGSVNAPPAVTISTSPLPVARVVDGTPAAVPRLPTLTALMSEGGAATPLPGLPVSRVIEAPRITNPLPSARVVHGSTPPTIQRVHEPSPLVSQTLAVTPVVQRKDTGSSEQPTMVLPVAENVEPSGERTGPLPVARIAEAAHSPRSTMDVLRTVRRTVPGETVDHGTGLVLNLPPVAVSRQVETPAVQRDPEAPPPAPVAPPAEVPVPAAAGSAAPAAPAAQPETEELVKKLFDPLLRRLKTELRLDRERRGALTDRPH